MTSYLFPFHGLCDREFRFVFSPSRLPLREFRNKFFSPFELTDRVDGEFFPDNNIYTESTREKFRSNYFNLDELPDIFPNLKSNSGEFTAIFLNIRSLSRNVDEFVTDFMPVLGNCDVLSFCETRLSSGSQHICEFISKRLSSTLVPELSVMTSILESIFVKVSKNNELYLVGCIYRPPSGGILEFVEELSVLLSTIDENFKKYNVLISGDTNIDILRSENNRSILEYISLMYSHSYLPIILRPTRVGSTSATLIDHIWTNSPQSVSTSGIILSNVSDHFAVFSAFGSKSLPARESVVRVVTRRVDSKARRDSMYEDIKNANWSQVVALQSVDEAYDSFLDRLTCFYEKNFPIVTRKVKYLDLAKPYITGDIKLMIKKKHKLQKLFNRWPLRYEREFKILRSEVSSTIRSAKAKYYRNRLNESVGNPRETWQTINSLLGRDSFSGAAKNLMVDGSMTDSPEVIADGFNRHFSQVGMKLASSFSEGDDFLHYLSDFSGVELDLLPTNKEEVTRLVKSFKDCSAGWDGLPMHIFKDNVDSLADVMVHICNLSLKDGVCPRKLTVGKVICIFKSGDAAQLKNYRPISILPAFSKLIEKLVADRIADHLSRNSLLSSAQYGFRHAISTVDAVSAIVNYIYDSFDDGEKVLGVFIDLAKAFDSLDRRILLAKLARYGIGEVSLRWMESYFSGRQQFVQYNGVTSSMLPVDYGVPQGSIVGPMLFVIFINDIVRCSDVLNFILYADDTNVFIKSSDVERSVETMNEELKKLCNWMTANRLTLNMSKLHYVLFHRRGHSVGSPTGNIYVDGVTVERESSTKFLGLILDENLRFDIHVTQLVKRLSKFVPILYNVRRNMTSDSLKIVYHCLIYQNLIYCNSIWGSSAKSNLSQLFVLQKKILRAMYFKPKFFHTDILFRSNNLLNLEKINMYMCCISVFRAVDRGSPDFKLYVCPYDTRRSLAPTVHIPLIRTRHSRQSLRWVGAATWNSLPSSLRSISCLASFRINLKKYLVDL